MSQYSNEIQDIIGLNNKKENKKIQSERAKVLAQIAEDKRTRSNLVKKALAAQKAKFGAGGSEGKSDSDQAVLKRIEEETAEALDAQIEAKEDKLSKIKRPARTRAPRNLLKKLLKQFESGFLNE
ncbi:MAG: hypothetical protein FWD33_02425 [Alphaproteobacteria bacterium]|nr:hypothetical protein [Alphaproteobacteria bacterium]